jgi:hypothetical protein
MIRFLFLIWVFFAVPVWGQQAKVIHVITHNRQTVVTNPSSGTNSYFGWGAFPAKNVPVRKVVMNLTLGSPDSLPTAHWDYLDHITLRRQGGKYGKSLDYEIGRMLTPYGSIYNKGWNWKWEVDVTDFAPFLRDSVEIEYNHSGYEPKTVGWSLTIDFEITLGPAVANQLAMIPLWNGSYKYGDPNRNIDDEICPIDFTSAPGAAFARIRIQHTGHGMDKPRGCSEFCSRWRDLIVDGAVVDHRNMWKDCGANPLYPQGGTWIYDRAYWCPGDLQVPDVIDVPEKPGEHVVSIKMQPYQATGDIQAVENISAYLFQYSKPNAKVDVAVDQIYVPNDEQQFSRLNPACFNPHFVIRNLGSENLHSVVITFGTDGFPKQVYRWKGNLAFNETAEIVIPGVIQQKSGENHFTVNLTKPNGRKDAWTGDNEMTTTFYAPDAYPTDFVLKFLTNDRPKDNTVFLIGEHSDTLFSRNPKELEPNTLYTDTLHLKPGDYELCLTDTAGDGLEFWAEPQNGDGYLRMFDMKGNLIHAFESDCGNGEKLSFMASPEFVTDTTKAQFAFSLYPRLVKDKTELSVVSNKTSEMQVLITVDAKVWEKHEYHHIKNGSFEYNLTNLPQGRIVVEVLMDGVSRFKGRINKSRLR